MLALLATVAVAGPKEELSKLEETCGASKKGNREKYAEFKPKFEAFAIKYPRTDQALTKAPVLYPALRSISASVFKRSIGPTSVANRCPLLLTP